MSILVPIARVYNLDLEAFGEVYPRPDLVAASGGRIDASIPLCVARNQSGARSCSLIHSSPSPVPFLLHQYLLLIVPSGLCLHRPSSTRSRTSSRISSSRPPVRSPYSCGPSSRVDSIPGPLLYSGYWQFRHHVLLGPHAQHLSLLAVEPFRERPECVSSSSFRASFPFSPRHEADILCSPPVHTVNEHLDFSDHINGVLFYHELIRNSDAATTF